MVNGYGWNAALSKPLLTDESKELWTRAIYLFIMEIQHSIYL